MKKLSIATTLLFIVSILFVGPLSAKTIQGQSNSTLGTYQIKQIAPVKAGGEELQAYQLSYENSENPITILVDKTSKCRNYIVRSKNLEVRYVCNKRGFGAKLVNAKFQRFDPTVNGYYLNEKALEGQGKLSTNQLSEEEALGLIAAYFPALAKDVKFLM
ncbi:hypothetical protein [Prolixibacter denitrificans]|uniref:Uncharacterized protein n=1 Tax=Prolixibacter denitrificans TaxID=1541063 RepID=A0A2P8CFW2_9BACT|nr:hypothetical protein [Prolixibacter denitrificans]PSK83789.1 hypothetical protein CLV93_103204 [Prolixibacter denitrificans]GET23331.1 hypothetical protein JCM18694_35770 [Prolixibacter denitrificans]